jgi:IS1 family transposase
MDAGQEDVTPEIAAKHPDAGDVWLWCAVDADSKFVASWRVGQRDLATAYDFVHDLADRLTRRVQLTSDGFRVYLEAVESAFGLDIDYAMLQKIYGADQQDEKRYSPAKIVSSTTEVIQGDPDPKHISTSFVERLNWSVRTSCRRYTRLSNGFSRKLRNHTAAVALNYFAYNFVRIHRTLRTSPAMAAGVTDRLWDVSDIVELLQRAESKKAA